MATISLIGIASGIMLWSIALFARMRGSTAYLAQRQYLAQHQREGADYSLSAEERAQALLGRLLGKNQLDQYVKNHTVQVIAKSGDLYQINSTSAWRFTKRFDKWVAHSNYCVFPLDNTITPNADQVLTLALHLLANERKFLSTANKRR